MPATAPPLLPPQELGARELAQLKPANDPCQHCGQCLTSVAMFEHDTIMLFVEKLVSVGQFSPPLLGRRRPRAPVVQAMLLNVGAPKASNQSCAALVALMSTAQGKNQSTYSDIVLKVRVDRLPSPAVVVVVAVVGAC